MEKTNLNRQLNGIKLARQDVAALTDEYERKLQAAQRDLAVVERRLQEKIQKLQRLVTTHVETLQEFGRSPDADGNAIMRQVEATVQRALSVVARGQRTHETILSTSFSRQNSEQQQQQLQPQTMMIDDEEEFEVQQARQLEQTAAELAQLGGILHDHLLDQQQQLGSIEDNLTAAADYADRGTQEVIQANRNTTSFTTTNTGLSVAAVGATVGFFSGGPLGAVVLGTVGGTIGAAIGSMVKKGNERQSDILDHDRQKATKQ